MSLLFLLTLVFESYASSKEKIRNLRIHIVIILFLPRLSRKLTWSNRVCPALS